MNSIENLWSSPKFRFLIIRLRYQVTLSRGWYKHFIRTFAVLNLFAIKIYKNYIREKIDVHQFLPTTLFLLRPFEYSESDPELVESHQQVLLYFKIHFNIIFPFTPIAYYLRARRSGDRISDRVRFSAPWKLALRLTKPPIQWVPGRFRG